MPEYPDQFENLTIPELKTIVDGDVQAVKSMMTEAAQHYPEQGLKPAANFYAAAIKFIEDNLSKAFDYIDKLDNSTVRHRTYVQFAQHTRKCRDVGMDEEIKRAGNYLNEDCSEQEFIQIYNKAISLMKTAIVFEERFGVKFWPVFHQKVRPFSSK